MFTPEHIHVMINHLPIIGIALAIVPFIIGYFKKNRNIIQIALILTFISAISVPIVMSSGAKAEENLKIFINKEKSENLSKSEISNKAAMEFWIEEHEKQAQIAMIPNYLLILVVIFALMYFKNDNKISKILNIATFILVLVTFSLNAWVGASGGKISHPEFRDNNPKIELQK